uniref:Uncharacterized protein n=1 Tax=Leersia perrieri TaxID=77586 RepID=A0A0D9X2R4_9ORYZ
MVSSVLQPATVSAAVWPGFLASSRRSAATQLQVHSQTVPGAFLFAKVQVPLQKQLLQLQADLQLFLLLIMINPADISLILFKMRLP